MESYIRVKRLDMNEQKLKVEISEFINKMNSNAAYYEENWAERKECKEYYHACSASQSHQANIGQLYSLTVSV